MAFSGQGAGAGAMSGAATGAMVGSVVPGIGTALGALGGGLLGAAGGGFGGGNQQPTGYSKSDLEQIAGQRLNQINSFADQLSSARQNYYNTTLPNFQKFAMSRFMPQIESNLAGRGLQVSGGAFAGALGRQATQFQADQSLGQYQDTQQQLRDVLNAQGQLSSAQMGGAYQNFAGPTPPNPAIAGFGNLAGQALMTFAGRQAQPGLGSLSQGMSQARQGSVLGQIPMGPMAGYQGMPYNRGY